MAALGHTVDSGSGASGDYASLNALEAAQEQDLTDGGGDTYTSTCTTTGDNAADTTAVAFSGWTTGVANYISIEAAPGDVAVKTGVDTSRYRLTNTTAGTPSLLVTVNHLRVVGLQIQHDSSATTGSNCIRWTGGAGVFHVNACRITNGRFGLRYERTSSAVLSIFDTIIHDQNQSGGLVNISSGGIVNCFNSVIYNGGPEGFRMVAGTATVTNCAVFLNTNDFQIDAGTTTIDFCASDDGDGTNSTGPSGADWDNEFVDPANGDFTLIASANLDGGGVDDPGSGLYSTDMEGDSYVSTWPIGVDQIVAAGGVNSVPLLRHRRRRQAA